MKENGGNYRNAANSSDANPFALSAVLHSIRTGWYFFYIRKIPAGKSCPF